MVWGGVKKSFIFSLGDDTILGDGQVKKFSSTPPPTTFSFGQNNKKWKTLNTRQKIMKIIETAKYSSNLRPK